MLLLAAIVGLGAGSAVMVSGGGLVGWVQLVVSWVRLGPIR
jgi:hypothetical protein